MRAAFLLPFALVSVLGIVALVVAGCAPAEPEAADVCENAERHLSACGVMLPVTRGGACTGARKMLAECMVNHADGCDEMASLLRRIDACIADATDAGDLSPGEPADLRAHDAAASRTDAATAADSTSEGTDI